MFIPPGLVTGVQEDMSPDRDDRVLKQTRVLGAFIVPFLLVAFVLLYFFPGTTKDYFAWRSTRT
jgi:hypothetical protein